MTLVGLIVKFRLVLSPKQPNNPQISFASSSATRPVQPVW